MPHARGAWLVPGPSVDYAWTERQHIARSRPFPAGPAWSLRCIAGPYLHRLRGRVVIVACLLEGVVGVRLDVEDVVAIRHACDVDPLPRESADVCVYPPDTESLISRICYPLVDAATVQELSLIACSLEIPRRGASIVNDAEAPLGTEDRVEAVARDDVRGERVRVLRLELLEPVIINGIPEAVGGILFEVVVLVTCTPLEYVAVRGVQRVADDECTRAQVRGR